jgi:hypothetical protein
MKNGLYFLDGRNEYWENNLLHREDGPAIYWFYEREEEWYYKGKKIQCTNLEEFQRIIGLLAFT